MCVLPVVCNNKVLNEVGDVSQTFSQEFKWNWHNEQQARLTTNLEVIVCSILIALVFLKSTTSVLGGFNCLLDPRDLADKILTRVSALAKTWVISKFKLQIYSKFAIWRLAIWQIWCFVQFIPKKRIFFTICLLKLML